MDYFTRYYIEQGASVIALDTAQNNKIVGVRVHRVVRRGDQDTFDPPPSNDENVDKILRYLEFAHKQFNPFASYDIDKFLDCCFIAVHRDYRGHNLGSRMMEFTFEFMRREKIPLISVLVSSKYSRDIMEKLGFRVHFEMAYEDYKENGQKVFFPDEIHKGFAVLSKFI